MHLYKEATDMQSDVLQPPQLCLQWLQLIKLDSTNGEQMTGSAQIVRQAVACLCYTNLHKSMHLNRGIVHLEQCLIAHNR